MSSFAALSNPVDYQIVKSSLFQYEILCIYLYTNFIMTACVAFLLYADQIS